jgi:PTH1 family peptidyl-tRNA hydrolase
MKLIFAQGNPSRAYDGTRHNVGFFMIDRLAKEYGVEFIKKPKFHALVAETTIHGEKILLVKPTTYYNETGQAARLLVDFYKLDPAHDFLVIHDDLALPFGTIRTRASGRDAGNNGIKSLNAHLGMNHSRIRIGIYTALRDRMDDADFVLARFTHDEQDALPAIFEHAQKFIDGFIRDDFPLTKIAVVS